MEIIEIDKTFVRDGSKNLYTEWEFEAMWYSRILLEVRNM